MVGGLNFLMQGMFGEKFRKLFQLVWCNNIHVCYWSGEVYIPRSCAPIRCLYPVKWYQLLISKTKRLREHLGKLSMLKPMIVCLLDNYMYSCFISVKIYLH